MHLRSVAETFSSETGFQDCKTTHGVIPNSPMQGIPPISPPSPAFVACGCHMSYFACDPSEFGRLICCHMSLVGGPVSPGTVLWIVRWARARQEQPGGGFLSSRHRRGRPPLFQEDAHISLIYLFIFQDFISYFSFCVCLLFAYSNFVLRNFFQPPSRIGYIFIYFFGFLMFQNFIFVDVYCLHILLSSSAKFSSLNNPHTVR